MSTAAVCEYDPGGWPLQQCCDWSPAVWHSLHQSVPVFRTCVLRRASVLGTARWETNLGISFALETYWRIGDSAAITRIGMYRGSSLGPSQIIPMSRTILLCYLCAALSIVFVLEQPGSARFGDLPRWRFFCDHVAYVVCLQAKHHFHVCCIYSLSA